MNNDLNYVSALRTLIELGVSKVMNDQGKVIFTVADELEITKKPVCCPNCGSEMVRLFDNESLYRPEKNDIEYHGYNGYDNEIYAQALCDQCENQFNVKGYISWEDRTKQIYEKA
jgi:Fe2+ or Zn2+ uptake regulation protein